MSDPVARACACVLAVTILSSACHRATVWSARTPDLSSELKVRMREGRACIRLDARALGCHDGVDVHAIAFDALGRHVALAVRVGTQWGIAIDGHVGDLWDGVGAPQMSSDGLHIAYAADAGGHWRIVHDTAAPFLVPGLVVSSLQLDADGCSVAYVVRRGNDVVVVSGTAVSPPWRMVRSLVLATDHSGGAEAPPPTAYAARDATGWHLVSNGMVGAMFEEVREVHLTSTGTAVAVARANGRESVVRVDRIGAWHDAVLTVSVGPDDRVGYVARDGEETFALLEDGQELVRSTTSDVAITDLALASAGKALWVTASSTQQTIVTPSGTFGFDRVIEGTLQFVDGRGTWTALVGDRTRRELRVVVNGRDSGTRFDWSEITRRLRQGDGANGLRNWVAAEARRIRAQEAVPFGR